MVQGRGSAKKRHQGEQAGEGKPGKWATEDRGESKKERDGPGGPGIGGRQGKNLARREGGGKGGGNKPRSPP